jgi:3-oxoacyl-[acyl-carrier-protein] synthase II
MNTRKEVVITGGGVVSGLGIGLDAFWDGLLANQTSIGIKDTWDVPDLATDEAIYYSPSVPFELSAYVEKLKPPFPLKYSQLALVGCQLALKNAGLDLTDLVPERLGLILDTTLSANAAAEAFLFKLLKDGPTNVSPFVFTKTTTNCALGDVARAFRLRGPSSILLGENSACYGYDLIEEGKADVVICGGFDEIRETTLLANYRRGYTPSAVVNGKHRPLSEAINEENGVAMFGEASAFVVLESAEHARRRGATVLAKLVDYHISRDTAYRDFIYERSAENLTDHLLTLCRQTGIRPAEVALLVGAGGLPAHIRDYEAPAIRAVWGSDPAPRYTNVKAHVGETLSASPLLSLLTGALCLHRHKVTGTRYDPARLGLPDEATTDTIDHAFADTDYAFVNSLHVGGNTVTMALRP